MLVANADAYTTAQARCSPTMLSSRSTGPTVARASGPIAKMNIRK